MVLGERRLIPFAGSEPPRPFAQRFAIVTRPHHAGVFKFAILVITDEQRAESYPRALRIRVPADDEFLLINAFELQPIGGSPMNVGAVRMLRNEAFPAFAASLLVVRFAPFIAM